jgi:hypothetical protein
LGRVVSYAEAGDVESFLEAVLKKRNFVMGVEGSRLRGILSQSKVFNKRIRYMPDIARSIYRFSVKNRIDELRPKIRDKISDRIDRIRKATGTARRRR